MKPGLPRRLVASLRRLPDSAFQRFPAFTLRRALLFCALLLPLPAGAQFSPPDKAPTFSISGQFVASGPARLSPLAGQPRIAADTNLVRLDPALLAVSAERIKDSLYRRLEIKKDAPWRGQIYLVVHPAPSLDEAITIFSRLSADRVTYRVELPDVLTQRKYVRALTGVILMEYANRRAQMHSAEIPAWLTDGLAESMLAGGGPSAVLSAPDKVVNGLPVARLNATQNGLDPLARARRVLETSLPLSYEQLTWPTAAQLAGDDGGAYRASAQLFVADLLALKSGPLHVRTMLESLPRCYNWQTAFHSAFRENFPAPLDLEKWWALQLAGFAAHDGGPGWTLAVSRAKLDEILRVPVAIRVASNSLPSRAEISLQTLILSMDFVRQEPILQSKLGDLGLAQLRMAPQLAALTDAYRRSLAGYLGAPFAPAPGQPRSRHASGPLKKTGAAKTLKTLDALDAQRWKIESAFKPLIQR